MVVLAGRAGRTSAVLPSVALAARAALDPAASRGTGPSRARGPHSPRSRAGLAERAA